MLEGARWFAPVGNGEQGSRDKQVGVPFGMVFSFPDVDWYGDGEIGQIGYVFSGNLVIIGEMGSLSGIE